MSRLYAQLSGLLVLSEQLRLPPSEKTCPSNECIQHQVSVRYIHLRDKLGISFFGRREYFFQLRKLSSTIRPRGLFLSRTDSSQERLRVGNSGLAQRCTLIFFTFFWFFPLLEACFFFSIFGFPFSYFILPFSQFFLCFL